VHFIFYYLTIKKNTEKYCKDYKIVDNENALHWDLKSIIESGMRHVYSLTPYSIVLCFIEFFITEVLDNYFRKMVDRKKLFEILKLCQIIHKVDILHVDN